MITEVAKPFEERELFYIRRNPPYRFSVSISVEEVQVSPEEQDVYNAPKLEEIEQTIEEMKECIFKLPFEILDEDELKEKLHEAGFDHFIDPAFPPIETSIWTPETNEKYPFKERPVWKRPKEFMNDTPKLFEGGIDPNDIQQGALGN